MTKARELAELGKAVSVHDNRLDFDRSIAHTGVVTANAGVKVDNITIDGTEIDLSSGDLTLDVANDIILDVDHVIRFHKNSTAHGNIQLNSNDLTLASQIADADIKFVGASGGSSVLALTLDMSANGDATFNGQVIVPQYVTHAGDGNTYLEFNTDQIDLYAGGVHGIQIVNNEVIINQGGADVNFRVEGDNQANLFVVDAGNDLVGIGTSSPNSSWSSANNLVISDTSSDGGMTILSGTSGNGNIMFADAQGSAFSDARGLITYLHASDALRFMTANAERMRIDSLGRVLIGTTTEGTSGAAEFTVAGSSNTGITIRAGTTASSAIYMSDATSGSGEYVGYISYSHSANAMTFATDASERMRILSGGNLLVGTTSESGGLQNKLTSHSAGKGQFSVIDTTAYSTADVGGAINLGGNYRSTGDAQAFCRVEAVKENTTNNNYSYALQFSTTESGNANFSTTAMRITSEGKVAIGTSSPSSKFVIYDATYPYIYLQNSTTGTGGNDGFSIVEYGNDAYINNRESGNMLFYNSNTERMRIDASGRVGVNTSSPDSKLHVVGRFHSSSNNATTHPGSNSATEHYISNYAKIGGKSLIGFSVAFPHGTSNLAVRLYALQNSLWISGDVIIGGTYSNGNASGFRRYSFTHNQNGSTNYNYGLTNTENLGGTNGHFELAGHGWDSSEGVGAHYWEFRHIASSGNAMYVQFETMGSGVAYSPNWYWRHTTY